MAESAGGTEPLDGAYERMRRVASRLLANERPDHTLQPTALVHEAWLRLARYRADHELSAAEADALTGQVMRRVLTDHARSRLRQKRGAHRVDPRRDPDAVSDNDATWLVVRVDDALGDLQRVDAELAQLVEMRFFGGYSLAEIAAATGVSLRTANRRWQLARAWLLDTFRCDAAGGEAAVSHE